MDDIKITDWMGAIGTLFAALVAAPAAVYAAVYTKRAAVAAAVAAAKAAEEAANQVKELRITREPKAVLKVRVPKPFDDEDYLKFGRGDGQYRLGPSVYLDAWNVSGPTIMVIEVSLIVDGLSPSGEELRLAPLTPHLLVESDKVVSIDVARQLLRRVALSAGDKSGFINFPDLTTAKAHFKVAYFSVNGEQSVEGDFNFQFRVPDDTKIVTWVTR